MPVTWTVKRTNITGSVSGHKQLKPWKCGEDVGGPWQQVREKRQAGRRSANSGGWVKGKAKGIMTQLDIDFCRGVDNLSLVL